MARKPTREEAINRMTGNIQGAVIVLLDRGLTENDIIKIVRRAAKQYREEWA